VEQVNNKQRTPNLFTAKELDEEIKLYYYGARYYDPRISLWISPDPALPRFLSTGDQQRDANLPGMGGLYNSQNLGLYTYTHQNPVRYVDPDGEDTKPVGGEFKITSPFGKMRTIDGETSPHGGVDMANSLGAPVSAFRSGSVANITQNKGGNNTVTLLYDKAKDQEQVYGVYVHVTSNLKVGDKIAEGQKIGVTDVSGNSTGPHLHYQQLGIDASKRNPTDLLKAAPSPASSGGSAASTPASVGNSAGSNRAGRSSRSGLESMKAAKE